MLSAPRRLRRFAPGLLAFVALPVLAVDESTLLPVEEAYVVSAHAPSRDRIEVDWQIHDGYYLYRHRTDVAVADGGFRAGELQLPKGDAHHDEYFGDVETYRGQLHAVLPGSADADAGTITLKIKYQGCADAGVCYPPQTRTLSVALPAAGATPAATGAAGTAAASAGLTTLLGKGAAATDAQPLPAEQAFVFEAIAGDGNTVLARFTPAKGYYLYRDRSSFSIDGAEGIRAGQPQWPAGALHHDEHFGDSTVYFNQVDVPLPVQRTRADAATVAVTASFQGCQTDGICYPPMTRTVQVALPAGTVNGADADTTAAAGAAPTDGSKTVDTAAASTAPAANGADASADNDKRSTPPPADKGGLLGALLLGLLGGLVLNLMPCVLPILSLKVLGLAQSGESRERARGHALWYTAGVLVAFAAVGGLVIALRATGQALGWGFQLQQPWFVAALVYLMFAVGLSLSGVFTLGGGFGNVGQKLAAKHGPAGDFFTGVLACVVASPCIAPFMGGALAYAFTAPAAVALLVFLALGLGLALPFLLIGFVPALATRLPRPGAWMETLKQFLAFPMYLTAIWLLWVLGKQRGTDAMALVAAGLVLLALGLWWYERKRWSGAAAWRALAALLVAASLLPVWQVTRLALPAHADAAQTRNEATYSPERLQSLRDEGRVVFVNMTADWCVTCKANERHVFSGDAFRQAMTAADAVYMRGDWTNTDPQISAFLDKYKAVGVPLYVVFPRGGGEGEVLPTVLTQQMVEDAIGRATKTM